MPHFVIMGAGRVGVMLARTLEASGHTVAVIDQDIRAFQPLRKNFGGKLVTGVGFDKETLERAGIEGAYAFAAVSSGDNSNVIAARVARETFKVKNVVARVYDPNRAEFFQRMGIPTVAAVRWSSDQVLRRILPEQAIRGDYREASGRLILTELPLHEEWAGHALVDIEAATGARIAYITSRAILYTPWCAPMRRPRSPVSSPRRLRILRVNATTRGTHGLGLSPPSQPP